MNAISETVVGIFTGLKYFSIIDLKILTKVLLRIGESIYTETWNYNMNRNNM